MLKHKQTRWKERLSILLTCCIAFCFLIGFLTSAKSAEEPSSAGDPTGIAEPFTDDASTEQEPSSADDPTGITEPSSETASTSQEPSTGIDPTEPDEPTADVTTTEAPAPEYHYYGDANGDGVITAADARMLMRVAVGLETIPRDTPQFYASDVDYDEAVNAADARLVLRAAVGLERFPGGELHKHVWGGWKRTVNPTCTSYGSEKRACVLDGSHVQTRALGKSEHSIQLITKNQTEGVWVYKTPFYQCSVCKARFGDAKGVTIAIPEYIPQAVTGSKKSNCDAISKRYSAVAVEAAVVKDGVVTQTYTYGTADRSTGRLTNEDTKYRVASLSKLVTAMVFMKLQELGLVSETQDISTYFGYKCRNPYYPSIVITPRLILTHSSGLIADGPKVLENGDLASTSFYYKIKPGVTECYSNIGYSVIACICERVSGMYLNALAKKYIFEPLDIDASYLASELKDSNNLGALYGEGTLSVSSMRSIKSRAFGKGLTLAQGNLTISAKDYAKILSVILNKGVAPNGKRILSEKSVEAMKKSYIFCSQYSLGYGMYREKGVLNKDTVYFHTGSAYGMFSSYLICPDERSGVVVLTSGCARNLNAATQLYSVCYAFIKELYPY